MTWTYEGAPGTATTSGQRDAVRFWVGDTDTNDQQVSDAEIEFAIAQEGDLKAAAAQIATGISAQYARKADKQVGDLRISYGKIAKHYSDLAESLRDQAGMQTVVPFAGGISVSSKNTYEKDSDRVAPFFAREQMDYRYSDNRLTASTS